MKKEKYIREWDNAYQVRIKYEDDVGKRKDYSKTFKFKDYKSKTECLKQACKHRDEMLYRFETNGFIKNTNITLSEVYEESKELFPLSYETNRKHDGIFKPVLEQYGSRAIKSLTAKDITHTLNASIEKSQDVINRLFSIWKSVYKCALISDYVATDPTVKVIVPKSEKISIPKSVVMECTLDDVIQALRNYGNTESTIHDCTIISYALIIMSYLGLRPAECYALTKSDFDLSSRTVTINKSVGSTHTEELTIKKTKTATSVRTIPLPSSLLPTIEDLFNYVKTERLFTFYDGSLVESKKATSIINNACRKVGIKFRPYMLRHAFSSNLIQNGVDVRTVMELMGHAHVSMSIDYARSTDALKRDAISKVGDEIGDEK